MGPKISLKKGPLMFQRIKTYRRRPQVKKFYKGDPPEVRIMIQNIILKFLKTKNQAQKDTLNFQNIKNIYKEASNQKVL